MGAANSHADITAAIRATADELQTDDKTATTSSTTTTALQPKLPPNPPYRDPTNRTHPAPQRRLHAPKPAQLDLSGGTRLSPLAKRQLVDAPPISPRKRNGRVGAAAAKQRVRDQQVIDEQLRVESVQETRAGPRQATEHQEETRGSELDAQIEVEAEDADVAQAQSGTKTASTTVTAPPVSSQQVEGETITQSDANATTTPKRKAGRPRKSVTEETDVNANTTPKRKPGRPRKSAPDASSGKRPPGRPPKYAKTPTPLTGTTIHVDGVGNHVSNAVVPEPEAAAAAATDGTEFDGPFSDADGGDVAGALAVTSSNTAARVWQPEEDRLLMEGHEQGWTIDKILKEQNIDRSASAARGRKSVLLERVAKQKATEKLRARNNSSGEVVRQNSTRAQRGIDTSSRPAEGEDVVDDPRAEGGAGGDRDEFNVDPGRAAHDEQHPDGDQAEEAELGNNSAEPEDGKQLPDNPLARTAPIFINPDEMDFGNNNNDDDEYNEDENNIDEDNDHSEVEAESQERTASNKRKASSQPTTTSSPKRAKVRFSSQVQATASSSRVAEREETPVDRQRLWGQWHILQEVFEGRQNVGVSTANGERNRCQISLKNKAVKEIVALCDEAIEKLIALQDPEEPIDLEQEDPAADFAEIGERVDELYIHMDEDRKIERPRRVQCIYFHLFPKLVELLEQTLTTYEHMDCATHSRNLISKGHLTTLNALIKLILDLGVGVKRYENPPANLAIVRPVNNDIVAPLKQVYIAFNKRVHYMEQAEEQAVENERRKTQLALSAEREAREKKQKAHVDRIRAKWEGLHWERRRVEGGRAPPDLSHHIRLPSPEPELDEDGLVFERVEVFTPRIGPPPALVQRAREVQWGEVEMAALGEGLRVYAGEKVFERIIRRFCVRSGRRGGVLGRFSVSEIVVRAAEWRKEMMREGGEVEGWVRGIPVWTPGGYPLGKENLGSEVLGGGDDDAHEDEM